MARRRSGPLGLPMATLALALALSAGPAAAQAHGAHATDDHAAMGHAMPTTDDPVRSDAPVDHAAMGHGTAAPAEAEGGVAAPAMDHATMDHAGMAHDAPPAPPQTPSDPPTDHSAMDHSAMDHPVTGEDAPAAQPSVPAAAVDHSTMDHSGQDHSRMGHAAQDAPEATDATDAATMPAPPAIDHSSMDHSSMDHSSMDHSSMDHPATAAGTRAADQAADAVTAAREPIPVLTDADRRAAFPDVAAHPVHDQGIHWYVLFDRLETSNADGGGALAWDATAWWGTDLDRLWVRSEGERSDGHTEAAGIELLYGRSVAPWWDVLAGIRHDVAPGDAQNFLALGVSGLAPMKFEVSATAYLGEGGRTQASLEAEYELLLTNRLVLQPSVEATLHGQDDPRRALGSGLGTVEAGLRLRYEITRRFAPYIGVARERAFGGTADYRRELGEDVDDTRVVAGVRFWF